jgi:haloalkane dehalogenase
VLEGFVAALGLEEVTVFGQDWGGPIGLAVATRHPDRIRALILGNTFAWPVTGDPHFERFSRLFGGRLGRVAIRRGNAFVNLLIPAGTRLRHLTRAEMRHYRRPLDTPARREPSWVFPREIIASHDFLAEVEANLPRLRDRPALLVWGDKDIAFRTAERRRFEQAFPSHAVVELPGAGHFVQEDAPERIAQAIGAWWQSVAPPT